MSARTEPDGRSWILCLRIPVGGLDFQFSEGSASLSAMSVGSMPILRLVLVLVHVMHSVSGRSPSFSGRSPSVPGRSPASSGFVLGRSVGVLQPALTSPHPAPKTWVPTPNGAVLGSFVNGRMSVSMS